ncbi:MAG: hypothetical protein WAN36_08400, partial [Calditrichia bacterium]
IPHFLYSHPVPAYWIDYLDCYFGTATQQTSCVNPRVTAIGNVRNPADIRPGIYSAHLCNNNTPAKIPL